MNLKGKKLLILGGNALICDIVCKAKEMGVYTIVTDWNDPSLSPAKRISDEYWMVSISNITELVQKIKEHNIDGVITNYVDSYLPFYANICDATGLPCLATETQMEHLSNKELSKQLCIKHGISVSRKYEILSAKDIDNIEQINYPVLTKPVDNSGQRGIYVCQNKEELKKLYLESLQFSQTNNVIVEEYVQGDYTVMFYTIQNGKVKLSTMADKPVLGEFVNNLPKLPQGYILPSKYVDLCMDIMLPKVQSFVTDLGIKNGVIGIEAVVKDNDIFVFEMQFRLGGMKHHNFVLKENGMDILVMLVRFALTGEFNGWDIEKYDNPSFNNHYCSLNVLIQPDTVARIEGLDEIKALPQVTNFTQMMEIGDSVNLPGTVQQILFKFSLVEENLVGIRNVIQKIYDIIRVYNKEGENIIISPTFLDELESK